MKAQLLKTKHEPGKRFTPSDFGEKPGQFGA
jgi:hypothetical protein